MPDFWDAVADLISEALSLGLNNRYKIVRSSRGGTTRIDVDRRPELGPYRPLASITFRDVRVIVDGRVHVDADVYKVSILIVDPAEPDFQHLVGRHVLDLASRSRP